MFRLIPAIFLATLAAPSWAQAPAAQAPVPHTRTTAPTLEQRFEAANTTHDGQLTKARPMPPKWPRR